ncbi:MAG: class I SAM-dependent methyltransferase [Daejeonella sp.]
MRYKEHDLADLFDTPVGLNDNIVEIKDSTTTYAVNQGQTKDVFSEKWSEAKSDANLTEVYKFQFEWFLSLYGFKSAADLAEFLKSKKVILDAGCGLGYKAAWLAELAPHAMVIGVDISDSVHTASSNFRNVENLFFLQSDISNTHLKSNTVDFVVCDQVIMHTENPEKTFQHLSQITSYDGEFACYVYRKKALPRELVDNYFRTETHSITNSEMWEFCSQLTELGKRLSELKMTFDSPDIPLLGIKGGSYDIQRFIYWNFLKCFWKEDWGFDLSKNTNFDWYAPSNAKRFDKDEFLSMGHISFMEPVFFHEEEACYTARFIHSGI